MANLDDFVPTDDALASFRCAAWSKPAPLGGELVQVRIGDGRLRARGVALGSSPFPYRLDYDLETAREYLTSRVTVTARGDGWRRTLTLRRLPSGDWEESGRHTGASNVLPRPPTDLTALSGALDVDLGLSPLFNTMPVLRHDLLRRSTSVDLVMAWISVPDLTVHRSVQRYSHVGRDNQRSVVRFESLGGDGFRAEVSYDPAGLVLDYPGVAVRVT